MQPRHLLIVLEDWKQLYFLHSLLESCYLWVDVGLVNGAMGTIQAICYRAGGPPDLPIAVMVQHSTMEQFPSLLYDVHGLH